jgi:nucleoside 2-deoxyribosyltransferase
VRKRIYLAGPDVFLPDAREIANKKKAICDECGFEGVSPADSELTLPAEPAKAAHAISEGNEELMKTCDLVIANMTPFRGVSMDNLGGGPSGLRGRTVDQSGGFS